METSVPTRLSRTRLVLAVSLVLVLLALLCLQLVVLPRAAASIVDQFPEVAYLRVPGVIWEIATILLLEVILVILTYLAVSKTRRSRPELRMWIKAILAAIATFTASILAAIGYLSSTDYATPGVMLALLLGLGVAAVGTAVAVHRLLGAEANASAYVS